MVTLEQIKEIQEKLAYVKASLRQMLVDLMFIDEIDLMNIETITFEQVNDIRKKFARLRMIAGEKMNVFLKYLGQVKEPSQSNHE
jgi:hypothetical protein